MRANTCTSSSTIDEDNLPFSEMVLRFADKVRFKCLTMSDYEIVVFI